MRALLHDAVAIYDALWDKTFEESQDLLDELADEAHTEYLAGQTEDFDPDDIGNCSPIRKFKSI